MPGIPHCRRFLAAHKSCRTLRAAVALGALLLLSSCGWKPSFLGGGSGDGPGETWSGTTSSGHRLTIEVEDRGRAVRLTAAPTWKLRRSFAEKLLRKEYGDSEADAVADLLAEYASGGNDGTGAVKAQRPGQSWDAGKQRLDYRAAGSSLYQGGEFRSRWDYPRTANYQFFFKEDGWGAAILNGSELLQLSRR